MRPWHLTISSVSRLALFPEPHQRRRALWKLAEVLGEVLALFCIVDDHLHVVVVCDSDVLGARVRALTRVVRALAAVEVNPTHVRRVEGRRHMQTLLDYLLRQPGKHELPGHPALWEGSCLPDLLGARRLPGLRSRLAEALPRATQADILHAAGLSTAPLIPVALDELRTLGASRLLHAAAAAAVADPQLRGKHKAEAEARRAACHLARAARIPLPELAWQLGVTSRATRRMAGHPAGRSLATTVRLRLALEERVGTR
jgi:hypothetical protein